MYYTPAPILTRVSSGPLPGIDELSKALSVYSKHREDFIKDHVFGLCASPFTLTDEQKEARELVQRHLDPNDILKICVQSDTTYEFEITLNEHAKIKHKYCPSVNGMVKYITSLYHWLLDRGAPYGVSTLFPTCDFDEIPKDLKVKVSVNKVGTDIFIHLSRPKKSTNTCPKCGEKMLRDKDTNVSYCGNIQCTGNITGILSYLEERTFNDSQSRSLTWTYEDGKVYVHSKSIGRYLVKDTESLLYLISYDCPNSPYELRVKSQGNSHQLNRLDQISKLSDLALRSSERIRGIRNADDNDEHFDSLCWDTNVIVYSDKYYDVDSKKFLDYSTYLDNKVKPQKLNLNGPQPFGSFWGSVYKLDDPTEFMVNHQSKVRFPIDIEPFVHGDKTYQNGPTYPGIKFYIKATDKNIDDIIQFFNRPGGRPRYIITDYDLLNDEVELKVGKV